MAQCEPQPAVFIWLYKHGTVKELAVAERQCVALNQLGLPVHQGVYLPSRDRAARAIHGSAVN